jgi:hypothetical protein
LMGHISFRSPNLFLTVTAETLKVKTDKQLKLCNVLQEIKVRYTYVYMIQSMTVWQTANWYTWNKCAYTDTNKSGMNCEHELHLLSEITCRLILFNILVMASYTCHSLQMSHHGNHQTYIISHLQ